MTAPTTHRPSPADLARRPAPGPSLDRKASAEPRPAPRPEQRPKSEPGPYEPRILTPAEAIAPGKLTRAERLRPLYQQGLRLSRMEPNARLTALTLLGYANFQTGLIHERWRPTTDQLSYATGITTGQVLVQLEVLTQRGWLYTRPLKDGPRAGEDALQLSVPAGVLEQLRARKHEGAPVS